MHSALHSPQISPGIRVFSWSIDTARIEDIYVDIWKKKKKKQKYLLLLCLWLSRKLPDVFQYVVPIQLAQKGFCEKPENWSSHPFLDCIPFYLTTWNCQFLPRILCLNTFIILSNFSLTWKIPFSLHYYFLKLIALVYISNQWSFFSQYPVLIPNLMAEIFPET